MRMVVPREDLPWAVRAVVAWYTLPWAIACYLALSVVFFWPALWFGAVPLPLLNPYVTDPVWSAFAPPGLATGTNTLLSDLSGFYYPYLAFTIASLRAGQFPLWNPYLFGRQPPPWNIGPRVRWCVWLVKQHRAKCLRIEHINIEMNSKMRDAFAGNPIQHWCRTFGKRIRPSTAKTELVDDVALDWHPGVKPGIHDTRWSNRCIDLAHQIPISSAKKCAKDLCVAMGRVFRREHIGMSIDPQHAEVPRIPRIQIGHRGEINEAIASQSHDPIRTVFLNRLARSACLLKERCATNNAVLYFKCFSWLRLWHRYCLYRAVCCRSQPGQQFCPKVVVVSISALPLRHVQSQRRFLLCRHGTLFSFQASGSKGGGTDEPVSYSIRHAFSCGITRTLMVKLGEPCHALSPTPPCPTPPPQHWVMPVSPRMPHLNKLKR
jgi:hypothetical protein